MKKFVEFLKRYPLVHSEKPNKTIVKPLVEGVPCCPFCGQPLVEKGKKRLETMCEHVSNPNGTPSEKPALYCVNPECKFGKVWLWNGKSFFDDGGETFYNSEYCFVEKEDGTREWREGAWELICESQKNYYTNALNTFACKLEREKSYGIYLHPILGFGIMRPFIEVYPVYKEDGTYVSESWRLQYLKKDKSIRGGEYCNLYVPGIHMFRYRVRKNNATIKRAMKLIFDDDCKIKNFEILRRFVENELQDAFGKEKVYGNRKPEWWRTASMRFTRITHFIDLIIIKKFIKNKVKLFSLANESAEEKYNELINLMMQK